MSEASQGSGFAAALEGAADRFATDLSARFGTTVSVVAAETALASAGDLLSRVGQTVVALERVVAGAAAGPILGLCSAEDGAWLAGLSGGQPQPAEFDPEQHREAAGTVLDVVLATAVAALADAADLAPGEPAGQAKVFELEQDLNRAASFLGEGDLSAAKLVISADDAGQAAVWVAARSDLVAAVPAPAPPPADQEDLGQPHAVQNLLRISVPVSVTLAEKPMPVEEILRLMIGQVVVFDRPCDEFLDLMVNNRCIGRGEVVKVGEKFGLRIVEIGDVKDTIRKLGQSESAFVS